MYKYVRKKNEILILNKLDACERIINMVCVILDNN